MFWMRNKENIFQYALLSGGLLILESKQAAKGEKIQIMKQRDKIEHKQRM